MFPGATGGRPTPTLLVVSLGETAARLESLLGESAAIRHAQSVGEALGVLHSSEDVAGVVSDAWLPDANGIALLEAVRVDDPTLPFVLFFENDPAHVGRAIAAQVTDYHVADDRSVDWERRAEIVERALTAEPPRPDRSAPRDRIEAFDRACLLVQDDTPIYANRRAKALLGHDLTAAFETIPDGLVYGDESPVPTGGHDQTRTGAARPVRLEGGRSTVFEAPSLGMTATATRWKGEPAVLYSFDDVGGVDRSSSAPHRDQYRQAVESSTDLLAAVDEELEFTFANEAYRAFHGTRTETVQGRSLEDVIGTDAFDRVAGKLDRALSGESVQFEHDRCRADGERRILDVHLYPLREGGAVVGVGASMRDVTADRVQRERLERLAEFRRLVAATSQHQTHGDDRDAVLEKIVGEIGSSDLFGCTFLALIDDTAPEFVCTTESALSDADVAAFHTPEYVSSVRERTVLELEDVTAPPYEQHVSDRPQHGGVAVAVEHDDTLYAILTVHFSPGDDVAELERRLLRQIAHDLGQYLHNQALSQELRTFREIADQIDDPIMLQDAAGRFELVNEALADYAASTPTELYGRDEFSVMDPATATEIARQKRTVMETGEPAQYEVTPSFPDRPERTFSTLRYPHYDDEGEIDGTVAICRDVTDIEERERQVQVMDRVLRHNVSNSMNVVLGYAETIAETTDDDRVANQAGKILQNGEQLVSTARKEREITKLLAEPPGPRSVDLSAIVRDAVNSVERDHPDVTVATALPETCRLTAVANLEIAVEELVRNAVVHSDVDSPSVAVTVEQTGTAVTIEIADDGPGIPEMERSILDGEMDVEPLYHGSGLGLWLVKLAVDRANGSLSYTETEPRGSVVTIRLPTT
ncbi:MAG: PAS domain-containing protein [Halanaeroarchaeum sp.]